MDYEYDATRLAELLRRLGATESEAAAAVTGSGGGGFALELAVRTGPPLSVAEAAAAAGVEPELFLRFWHALGLATPPADARAVPSDIVAALPVVTEATRTWLGDASAFGIARVVGSTSARIAEALVDAFRMGFEVPELTSGTSYAAVVETYVEITHATLPAFQEFVAAVIKAHLVRVASGTWSPDDEHLATRRELFVGFVDLVGYTALSRTLSPGELAALLGAFEDTVGETVTAHGGRLVKLIGDGAMFVSDNVPDGCRTALELSDRLTASDALPPARVGADCGPVLSLYGDYFGEVVNRAARLVALANPSTVVVSDVVMAAGGRTFGFEQLPPQALKGFHAPAVTYRLLAR